jgi:NADH-quinone oxidoreductase subunit J
VSGEVVAFAFVAALVLGGGLGVVTARNVAHAALFLLMSLAAVAGVFVLLVAEFLALVQVLIYGGAIIIVLLFALMLTRLDEFSRVRDNPQRPLAILAALAVAGALAAAFVSDRPATQEIRGQGLEALGSDLFTNWVVPFEIASLVLLVALIGAVLLARAGDVDGD